MNDTNINNQREGKNRLELSACTRGECDLARRRCRGRAKYAAGQPAAASSQPRPALVSLTSPHQPPPAQPAPWYHLITYEVINHNDILTTYSGSVLREPLFKMLRLPP